MKKFGVVLSVPMLVTMLVLMMGSIPASAQPRFGVEGCFGEDIDFGVGVRMMADLGYTKGLGFTGSFDYFFPDIEELTYFEVNGLVTYAFPLPNTNFAPYAGGGLTLGHASADFGDFGGSDNEIMPSIVGGFKMTTSRGLKPFFELRLELSGYEQFVFTGGVLF